MTQPRTFGPYTLLRRLAVGGMAEIYVASTRGLAGFEKLAALKLVHPHLAADPQFVRMLVEEAKILVLLSHANIAQVFDLGCIHGTYYIAMEFVDGLDVHGVQTVAQRTQMPLPVDVCAYVVAEMLNGLDYAHRKRDASGRPLNIVHRDISPQNVVVSHSGEVKLVDFGIAKSSRQSEGTEAGVIKGKYFYMSPEHAWGDATDRRSDVFSTGILLFEMLTGQMLYSARSVPELLAKVRRAEVPHPASLRADLPKSLCDIVLRALQREPSARFQSAIDMGEALRDFLYEASPTFNAGKLGEFVTRILDIQRAQDAAQSGVDDTRRMRALTREDFVRNDDSMLFRLGDVAAPATRQHAPHRTRRPPGPRPEDASRAGPPPHASIPGRGAPTSPGLPTGRDPSQGRISTWPFEDYVEEPTELWRPRFAADPGAPLQGGRPVADDTEEQTARYSPAHLMRSSQPPRSLAPTRPSKAALVPSVLPSLTPPARLSQPFGAVELTGTGKVALVPPRGEANSLGPIPPSPPVPDFRARSRAKPWLAIVLGLLCAAVGIVGYQFVARSEPVTHLEIISEPTGAVVRVDGEPQAGTTPMRLSGLKRGQEYTIEVQLDGYQPWSSSHRASGTNVQQIAVLQPLTRKLEITSKPPGADVFLGDARVGRTPLTLPGVEIGRPQRLSVQLSGYAAEERELPAGVEQTPAVVHFDLVRARHSRNGNR